MFAKPAFALLAAAAGNLPSSWERYSRGPKGIGRFSSPGQGRGAHLQLMDLVWLLIAQAGEQPEDARKAVEVVGEFRHEPGLFDPHDTLFPCTENMTLPEFLAGVVDNVARQPNGSGAEKVANDSWWRLQMSLASPRATVSWVGLDAGGKGVPEQLAFYAPHNLLPDFRSSGMSRSVEIGFTVIQAAAEVWRDTLAQTSGLTLSTPSTVNPQAEAGDENAGSIPTEPAPSENPNQDGSPKKARRAGSRPRASREATLRVSVPSRAAFPDGRVHPRRSVPHGAQEDHCPPS